MRYDVRVFPSRGAVEGVNGSEDVGGFVDLAQRRTYNVRWF